MAAIADLAQDERTARMVLSMIAEPDDSATGRVLFRVGAVEALRLIESDNGMPGMNRVEANVWRDRLARRVHPEEIATRPRSTERAQFGVLIPGDHEWPAALNDLGDRAPYVLWTRGATTLLSRLLTDRVTLTGARGATAYGENVGSELAGDLAARDRVIVAGGAYGIEGAAHRVALAAGGDTITVLVGGVDRPYPARHRDLLDRVADVGLLMSEMPSGATPTRHRFLARGRIMAALSGASVVVEAATRAGFLRVAAEAHRLARGVGAVPGPVTSVTSAGPHRLLREGKAEIVTDAADITRLADNAAPTSGTSLRHSRIEPEFGHRAERSTDHPGRSLEFARVKRGVSDVGTPHMLVPGPSILEEQFHRPSSGATRRDGWRSGPHQYPKAPRCLTPEHTSGQIVTMATDLV